MKILKLLILLAMIYLILPLAVSVERVNAATTHYIAVAPEGNDTTGDGSENLPWTTFNYAISQAAPGDTIIAKAGTYNQSVLIRDKDGITLKGTLGPKGERLSIIDPYVDVGGEWVKDKPGDPNDKIYKKYVGWKSWAYVVEIEGKRYKIWRVCQHDTAPAEEVRCKDHNINYRDVMNHKNTNDYPVTFNTSDNVVGYLSFWDGIGMLGTVTNDGWAYFAEQDGRDINEYKILFANKPQWIEATVNIFSSDSVTIKDFEIRANKNGIMTTKYGGNNPDVNYPSNLVIDNNKIFFGKIKINLYGNNNTITNNILTDYTYSGDYLKESDTHGAWGVDYSLGAPYKVLLRNHIHRTIRYTMNYEGGGISSNGVSVHGNDIVVAGNNMSNLFQGILSDSPNIRIYNNSIQNMTQICWVGDKLGKVSIYDNTFHNCNALMRVMEWDKCPKQNDVCIGGGSSNYADIKIYNNKFWQEPNTGSFIKIHYNKYIPTGNINPIGKIWMYHNSFSGGYDLFNIGSYFGYWRPYGGTGGINLVNNILSSTINQQGSSSDCLTGQCTANLGACSNNWASSMPGCNSNSNNVINENLMWNTADPHNFRVPAEYEGDIIRRGVDITQSPYDLPWESAVPYPAELVDIGYVHGEPQFQATDVNRDGQINIKDIQAVIKEIMGSSWTCHSEPCSADVNGDRSVNIKDIQEIIRAIIG